MTENTHTIDPEYTMLLVMDDQLTILNRLSNVDELLVRMVKMIDTARGGGVRIGYV